MSTKVNIDIQHLLDITERYLLDAGFTPDLYTIEDFSANRGYIEIYFESGKAIDYLIKDLEKTNYKYFIEIKKYRLAPKKYTAIITSPED